MVSVELEDENQYAEVGPYSTRVVEGSLVVQLRETPGGRNVTDVVSEITGGVVSTTNVGTGRISLIFPAVSVTVSVQLS